MIKPYTKAQKDLLQEVIHDGKLVDIIYYLTILADRVRDSVVSLPHINEDGNKVIHGCNMDMIRLEEYLRNAIQALRLN
tara:strand:+ start:852 stop:1088 length:237 start_codon:yes stop_codon:yes gene_type:complete